MADNVDITAGTGTTISTDDVGGVQYQRVKIDLGGNGAASPLVRGQQASADSLPVVLSTEQGAFIDGLETLLTTLAGIVSSARAAVNLIASQAGITGGAGSVAANTPRMTLASDDPAVTGLTLLANGGNINDYETVAAGQTTQTLGATGASGDWLDSVLIVPATTAPGAVAIKDGANSAITIFTGGADSVNSLVPFSVLVGAASTNGAWQVTTGSNVSAIGFGKFT